MTKPRCILIVEDEPLIAMMLEDFILSLGHEVRGPCETVAEALREVAKDHFDLAILDVNLKGESVWPVAAALRASETFRSCLHRAGMSNRRRPSSPIRR